ncbi:MAG: LysM peptidoglycan-binding domain-containing protein [Planctomycetes bacterium]|nr:LysM peptidoglycan-binding domain-containing protein [Planctomycetota bacterium]MCC7172553.1 LysM peptidoglycan-binding domain-containing protein [Planctomycetota bacterium]
MGNVGGIEKILVGCILVIILAILGIAVSSSNEPDDPVLPSVASKPERTKDPANGGRKKDGAPALMGDAKEKDADRSGTNGGMVPRRIEGSTRQEERDAPHPVDITDDTPPVKPKTEPTTAPKVEPTQPEKGQPKFHVVTKGDSIEKIAVQYYDDRRMAAEILKLNEDIQPTKLKEGQKVLLPDAAIKSLLKDEPEDAPSEPEVAPKKPDPTPSKPTATNKYKVKKGDTILSICRDHYGSIERWQEVLKANGLKDGKDLREGMELTLP